jgi:hypothetical protein
MGGQLDLNPGNLPLWPEYGQSLFFQCREDQKIGKHGQPVHLQLHFAGFGSHAPVRLFLPIAGDAISGKVLVTSDSSILKVYQMGEKIATNLY